jgi:quinate dehydrogenase
MESLGQITSSHRVYIAGSTGGHSIAPLAHNYISKELGKGWTMEFLERPAAKDVIDVFCQPAFAGGVVTMPHKKTIIPYLDSTDDSVHVIGACNVVKLMSEGKLHGTNTDWVGIKDSLFSTFPHCGTGCALVYGAGGASRAAIYALASSLGYHDIYIINRCDGEVAELEKDVQNLNSSIRPNLIYVKTAKQAKSLLTSTCIISTVPI